MMGGVKKRGALVVLGGAAGVGWLFLRSRREGLREVRPAEPVLTDLLERHAGRIDFVDAWAAPIADGETDDPSEWAKAFTALPPVVVVLLRVRDALARPFGLITMADYELPPTLFPLIAERDRELVLGVDDEHLNFRVGVSPSNGRVTFSTTVTVNNWLGRLYWVPVRWFHPLVVSAMLRRARP
jgi:hypothetical protein